MYIYTYVCIHMLVTIEVSWLLRYMIYNHPEVKYVFFHSELRIFVGILWHCHTRSTPGWLHIYIYRIITYTINIHILIYHLANLVKTHPTYIVWCWGYCRTVVWLFEWCCFLFLWGCDASIFTDVKKAVVFQIQPGCGKTNKKMVFSGNDKTWYGYKLYPLVNKHRPWK